MLTTNPSKRRYPGSVAALAAILACSLAVSPALAQTARELFAEGNRLVRDDLYWAALLRYEEAAEQGMDTPLLHYNRGVAHYRAQQHVRAQQSLRKAAESPRLRILAHYNLGLNAYAGGDTDEALRWFRLARDQQQNTKIAQLARRAIARLSSRRRQADAAAARPGQQRKHKKLGEFDFRASVSFGNDSNVFRAPDVSYVDFADPNLPLVTPVIQSGAYLPIDLRAKYTINSLPHESFFGGYRLRGRYYQDKALTNANEFVHEASFGSHFRRQQGTRTREVYSAFKVAQHDETYYDPDDGAIRNVGGVSVGDRLNYLRYGPEIKFRQSHEKMSVGARLKGQLWNYEDVVAAPGYDHEYFLLGVDVQYRFAPSSLLRLTVEKQSRRYGDRPSFDLDGQQRLGNATLRYDYIGLGLLARQRITPNMWFGFGYERTDRQDKHAGYNDYIRNAFEVEFHWSAGARFKLDVSASYRSYDFANAFAFNDPAIGNKTLEATRADVAATYRMTDRLSLLAEFELRDSVSNDTRNDYSRNQFVIGVVWEQ